MFFFHFSKLGNQNLATLLDPKTYAINSTVYQHFRRIYDPFFFKKLPLYLGGIRSPQWQEETILLVYADRAKNIYVNLHMKLGVVIINNYLFKDHKFNPVENKSRYRK
jgi:hypothetical protein